MLPQICRPTVKPSNHAIKLLHLLNVQRTEDRRESFKHDPADAHDARPAVELLRLL